jgi:hypothetical protein
VATTDKVYYVVTWKPAYVDLLGDGFEGEAECVVVALAQGGFGEDVVDALRQVKERYLEFEFAYQGIELDRTEAVFDRYFTLTEPDQYVDLDEV